MGRKKPFEEFIKELAEKQPDIELVTPYVNMSKKVECRCKICGRVWATTGTRLLTVGQGCPNWRSHSGYTNPRKALHTEFVEKLLSVNLHYSQHEFELLSEYNGADNPVACRCLKCKKEWYRNAYDLINKGSGCPYCSALARGKAARKTNKQFLSELFENNGYYREGLIDVVGNYVSSKEAIECMCITCKQRWDAMPQALLNGTGCPRCAKSGTSRSEQFIVSALELVFGEGSVCSRDKSAIGQELDIYLPKQKLAIEYGSWFWHKNRVETDLEKIKKCREADIEIITIYDQCKEHLVFADQSIKTYSFDLWTEKDQASLKAIVANVINVCGVCYYFSETDWDLVRSASLRRTALRDENEFKRLLKERNEAYAKGLFELAGEYKGAHTAIDAVCNVCGCKWSPDTSNLLSGSGCPSCAGNVKKSQSEIIEEIAQLDPAITVIDSYKGASEPLQMRCDVCGYEWKALIGTIRQGKGCPNFRRHPNWKEPISRTQSQFEQELALVDSSIEVLGRYKNANTKIRFRCKRCGNEWLTRPSVILNHRSGCPECAKRKRSASHRRPVECVETGVIYDSCSSAAEAMGLSSSTSISSVCKGRRKKAAGFTWRYSNNANSQ